MSERVEAVDVKCPYCRELFDMDYNPEDAEETVECPECDEECRIVVDARSKQVVLLRIEDEEEDGDGDEDDTVIDIDEEEDDEEDEEE